MSDVDNSQNLTTQGLAQDAVNQGNWGLAVQYLQQWQQQPELPMAAIWRSLALRTLEMGDFQTRWDVAKLISHCGPDLVQPKDVVALIGEASEEDWSLLWFLVRILGEFHQPESVSTLVDLLQRSPSEDVVAAITTALSQIGEPAIAPVSQLLDSPQTRHAAVQILARIRHPDAAAAVACVVNDSDPAVRALAITTLGDVAYPQAQPLLIAALRDVAAEVRRAAVVGLGARRDRLSSETIEQMGELLWDVSLSVRRAAISALGRLNCKAAADLLYDALQSSSTPPILEPDLLQALASTETRAGLDHLAVYAEADSGKTDSGRRISAIAASLGRIKTSALVPKAVGLLMRLLTWTQSGDRAARQAIATSLGQLGQVDSTDTLIAMLSDADTGVRLHVTAALRKLAPTEAYRRLVAIAASPQTSPDLRQNASLALQDWDQSASPGLR
ncbi:MAG: HEAT repeat domain-containing protein [Elainellaceae cyanobacterium]